MKDTNGKTHKLPVEEEDHDLGIIFQQNLKVWALSVAKLMCYRNSHGAPLLALAVKILKKMA